MKERTLLYTRLAIMFFLICWVGMVYYYVEETGKNIEFIKYEQYGIKYHSTVLNLIHDLQTRRTLEVLSRLSNEDLSKDLSNSRDNIINSTFLLRGMNEDIGVVLNSSHKFEDIRNGLNNLLKISPEESIDNVIYDYSEVIDSLINLIQYAADNSNLILEPNLMGYYLMNINVKTIPYLAENISKMTSKALIILADKSHEISEQEKLELFILQGSVNRLSEQLLYNYSVLDDMYTHKGMYDVFSDRKNIINVLQPKFLTNFYEIIAEGNKDISIDVLFKGGMELAKAYMDTYSQNNDELKNVLNERSGSNVLKINLLIIFAIAVAAAIILFYYVFSFNLAKKEEVERQIIQSKETLEKDVQDRTRELRQQKSLFESIIEHIPLAIFAKDIKDNYSWLFVNKKGGDLFCVDTKTIIGFRDHDIFIKEQADFVHKIDEQAVRSNEIIEIEDETITTLKGNFRAHIINVPIYDSNGSPDIVLGILEDITEKQRASEKMRMLEASVEHSEDTVIITDTKIDDGGPYIIYVNPAIRDVSGYKPEELIGKPLSILYGVQNIDDRRISILRNNLLEGKSYHGEIINYTKDGSEYWVFINIFPIPDEQGKIINYAAIQRDITRERAMRDELIRSKRLAEQANETKTDFLANMSHELRTPLNSILGMTRMLKESDITDEQKELVGTVFQSSVNLLEIVNDILDLSKIEAGEVELERIGFDLGYNLKSVGQLMSQLAREKKLEFVESHKLSGIPYVLGDPTRLTRIMNNLVGNAIKYTLNGFVKVISSYDVIDDKNIKWTCEVVDSGIGIPEDKVERIFDKFTQADISTTRKFGGTGLGLTITKELVELMGGKIEVESQVGKGSTFRVIIPFEATDALQNRRHSRNKSVMKSGEVSLINARVLVAEDHPMNKLLIEKILQRMGIANLEIVENGVLVLKKLKEEHYDVILMDCHMPEKNGYDTTIDIRKIEESSDKHIPIVAMTANAMVGDRDRCLRVGMDDYVSKPIDVDELKEVLSQWISFEKKEKEEEEVKKEENEAVDTNRFSLDLSLLDSFTGGDPAVRKEFIDLYLEQSEQNIVSLRDNCLDGHNETWSETAHQLKGASANVGATELSKLCADGQNMIDGTQKEREELFAKIEDNFLNVKEYLLKVVADDEAKKG